MAKQEQSEGPVCGTDMDIVSIKKLQLPHGVVCPNVWGIAKEQPVLVTIVLTLRNGLQSAASKDALDRNTVHYGELAKRIRAASKPNQTLEMLTPTIFAAISSLAMRDDGTCKLSQSIVLYHLPKASMYGNNIELVNILLYNSQGKATLMGRDFGLREANFMALIGVNDYERTARQPLTVGFDISLSNEPCASEGAAVSPIAIFDVERNLAKVCSSHRC